MKKILIFLITGLMILSQSVAYASSVMTFSNIFKASSGDNAINLPATTFNYVITTGTGSAATADSPRIKDGIGAPTITNAAHAATASGVVTNSTDVTIDFTNVPFTEAGIYRYLITETLASSSASNDIQIDVNNSNLGTYVLDVYVKNEAGGYEPYAYILTKAGSVATYDTTTEPNQTVIYNDKVGEIVNEYTTYDLTISKTIIGNMAANSFDFTTILTNVPTDIIFTHNNTESSGMSSYTFVDALGNGDTISIKGLPSTVAYSIKEAVNQVEGYEVTVVDSKDNSGYNWGTPATSYGKTDATTMGQEDVTVDFTNELKAISPTGVVLRFAPYAIMLAAGVILLIIVLAKKRKTN